MAPDHQVQRSFDPSRDGREFPAAYLQSCGLTQWHIPFYRLLCRLCPAGQTRIVFPQKMHLLPAILQAAIAAGEGTEGLSKTAIDRKLDFLASNRAAVIATGWDGGQFVIEFIEPSPKPRTRPALPPPKLATVDGSGDKQGQLFEGQERSDLPLRLYVGDGPESDEEPGPGSGFQNPGPGNQENRARVSCDEHTSYSRARHAVDVDDDDDVDVVSTSKVEIGEIQDARAALCEIAAQWLADGIPDEQRLPNRKNLSTWLKTHTAMRRGIISRAAYDEGLAAPKRSHDAGGIEKTVWHIMWAAWRDAIGDRRYRSLLRSFESPIGWEDMIRGRRPASTQSVADLDATAMNSLGDPVELAKRAGVRYRPRRDAAPNGEYPQRE